MTAPLRAGITALDIAHTPCSDADVACTIARLPRLQSLRLDNCRKLSASICVTVFSQAHCRLHTLCLQRCFQVTSATLVDALTAAQQPNSELVTLTLSHIHFLGPLISLHKPHDTASLQVCLETSDTKSAGPGNGPADDAVPQVDSVAVAAAAGHTQNSVNTAVKPPDSPALPLPQPLPLPRRSESAMPLQGSSLRVLALSCCDELGLAHLASIASCTPALRVLLLGGTAMALPVATAPAVRPWRPASATREPAALTVYRQERAVLAAVEKLVQRMWAALVHEDAVAAAETAGNAAHAGPAAEEPSVVEAGADGTRRPVSAISMCGLVTLPMGAVRSWSRVSWCSCCSLLHWTLRHLCCRHSLCRQCGSASLWNQPSGTDLHMHGVIERLSARAVLSVAALPASQAPCQTRHVLLHVARSVFW